MPKIDLEDTITALATPPGEGGIAVIRVSGKEAISLAEVFFRPSKNGKLGDQPTHTLHHGLLVDEKEDPVDEVLIGLFRSPHSFTGEDVVEIHCHGGIRLTRRILELLVRRGARPAEPGEFTKRAFLHGKMDLMQAEAVLDLIRAQSEVSLKTALCQLEGTLSKKIHSLKEGLLKISAHLEASLDFPDERLEVYSRKECLRQMGEIEKEIRLLIESFKRGLLMREGALVVIVGRPNVGKSSLFNALLARDRALVSPVPGTTRDALEEPLEIARMAVRLVDTAGLRKIPEGALHEFSLPDQMGMQKTRTYLKEGDLFLFVVDGSSPWTAEDQAILSAVQGKNFLIVINKTDLSQKLASEKIQEIFPEKKPSFISCTTGMGFPDLEKRIGEELIQSGIIPGSPALTRLRHKLALEEALQMLEDSRKALEERQSAEFVLVDLRSALDSLRELMGEVYSEDLLDVIFQEFCIGK